MRGQIIKWDGDNAAQADHLLRNHQARADKAGDKLNVIGIGLNVTLNLGDSLIVDGDRLGILRAANNHPVTTEFVAWEGDNLPSIRNFLKRYQVRIEVHGFQVCLYGDESSRPWFVLDRGDRLVKRDGQIIVSKAAQPLDWIRGAPKQYQH